MAERISASTSACLLPDLLGVPETAASQVRADYDRFARDGLPRQLEEYLLDRYGLDVATTYAGLPIPNPWGKASGQLSMTARQVEEDVEAGLGFVVLKTVIAQDAAGAQSMQAWAIREARMVAERIVGRSGEEGWTISWKGRGWWLSFDEYLDLVRDAQQIARGTGTLIVPSCKYHLPTPDESDWKIAEYEHTTRRLLEAWHGVAQAFQPDGVQIEQPEHGQAAKPDVPAMPLEKDFSPTLAGSDRATQQAKILEWLRTVPGLIRDAAPAPGWLGQSAAVPQAEAASNTGASQSLSPSHPPQAVRVGLKIFNALFDDDFQLEMLRTIHQPGPGRPDFYVYANRLFDPGREFDGRRGIAYGGPDLSDRNLRVMTRFQSDRRTDCQSVLPGAGERLPWSATGNITTGKLALEYALRGASSFQLHTFFQLPADQYAMKSGSKTHKALHELYFHPRTGFIVWMHHLAAALGMAHAPLRFADLIGLDIHDAEAHHDPRAASSGPGTGERV